ncbi:hypothetical protein SPAR64_0043 [Streptococcus pneumoniae GA40410]|nr:hypothetical protein SPAR50_0031 [Streptococcus pneumoniae GA17570]EHD60555.1 hypothetical protein SPAR85_0049 [Streptococcus pneumoniae GA44500]EHE11873.1 hypothetical protein SPAR52_0075 [Streptococcus pneumoniae GA17971]EHE19219.1 hypothetical protein SPAR67_0047 [Streptococcus pneumoniae GA41277]EHZ47280.1 hypothetical protein SPAR64_0043 [Streptococcus pneumoniae GA40410]
MPIQDLDEKINRYCYTKLVKFVTRQILKIKRGIRYEYKNDVTI